MRTIYLTTLVLFLLVLSAGAQTRGQMRTFAWTDMMCEFRGTYDSRRYSEAQLKGTLKLFAHDGIGLPDAAAVWKYEDIARLDVPELDRSYKAAREEMEKLNIVNTPYWEGIRQKKLRAMEQEYRLQRTTMIAYTKHSVLAEYPAAEACKAKYAGPIASGGDELLRVWREVNLESQSNNADPARLQRIFEEQYRSPDRLKFALVETMNFGWWNCANEEMRDGEDFSPDMSELAEEFRKLFTRVHEECDEP